MKNSRRKFIKNTSGIAAGLFTHNIVAGGVTNSSKSAKEEDEEILPDTGTTLAGVAEMDISPELGMEKPANYVKNYHTSFHDPCKVRAVVFDDGSKRVALVGIDALMIPRSLVKAVRKRVSSKCGIKEDAILIGASHSHTSGPLGFVQPGEYDHGNSLVRSLAYDKTVVADPKYLEFVENSIVDAICNANKTRSECNLGIGVGIEDKAGVNRRYYMENGLTHTYPGRGNPDIIKPAGPIDPDVGVIGIWDSEGKCIGCVVNFARHANCPVPGISANWIYFMEQTIRGAMGSDCIVVFLAGANGNISHDDQHDPYVSLSSLDKTRYVGSRVGAEVVKVLLSIPRGRLSPIDFQTKVWNIDRRVPDPKRVKDCYELAKQPIDKVGSTEWIFAKEIVLLDALLEKHPSAEVEVQTIQVGPAVFVSNPAEYFCEYGLDIKNRSHFKYTFSVELANGSVGYVPTEDSFGPNGGGYETRLTSYSNLEITAGTQMADAGVELIRKMKPGIEPDFPPPPEFKGPWSYGNVKPELD